MIVANEDFWQSQRSQVSQIEDPEDRDATRHWLNMVEGLCDHAESIMSSAGVNAPEAFRLALAGLEEGEGRLPVGALAHSVILVLSVWHHGEELFESMSYLEKRLVTDEIVRLQHESATPA